MAFYKTFGVMVAIYSSILTFSALIAVASSAICPPRQYLNSSLQFCTNCTDCRDGTVVLRPCEFHRDTHCGPISELIRATEGGGNPHRHQHSGRHHHAKQQAREDVEIEWRFGDDVRKGRERDEVEEAADMEVVSSEATFSGAETAVWDWQAVTLTSAVFACILFFLVITLYSLHQAKQWRRLKDNFEADVEELSARLSLMAASTGEKGEFSEKPGSGPISDANYLNSRCVYLEHLLSVRKDGSKTFTTLPKGNVYIEDNKTKT